jgi:hypothetical protein
MKSVKALFVLGTTVRPIRTCVEVRPDLNSTCFSLAVFGLLRPTKGFLDILPELIGDRYGTPFDYKQSATSLSDMLHPYRCELDTPYSRVLSASGNLVPRPISNQTRT